MAVPTKEELAEAVDTIEKKATKFEKSVERWKSMHGAAKGALGMTAKVAPFMPLAGMAVTYATGRADAMVTTTDVRNPVTIVVGGLSWVGAGVCAWLGKSIPAVALSAAATASLGALTHDVGSAAGEASKAQG